MSTLSPSRDRIPSPLSLQWVLEKPNMEDLMGSYRTLQHFKEYKNLKLDLRIRHEIGLGFFF